MAIDDTIEPKPKKEGAHDVGPIVTPPDETISSNWYVLGSLQNQRDIMVSASRAADSSGEPQQVHLHPKGTSCDEMSHAVIYPDPARHRAIRGPENWVARLNLATTRELFQEIITRFAMDSGPSSEYPEWCKEAALKVGMIFDDTPPVLLDQKGSDD